MKHKSQSILFIVCILAGCNMDSVIDWGDDCPGINKEGKLSYISEDLCSAENPLCTFETDDKKHTYDFSKNFEINRCPSEFPQCIKSEAGYYYCEAKKNCADGYFPCNLETGKTICVDPAANSTCGASENKCSETHFGGLDCDDYGDSTCKLRNGKYSCQCRSGAISCGNECLSPASSTTCGATDCQNRGKDCTSFADIRECREDDNGIYSCQCRKGDILCDGKCITPSDDNVFCGAKGECTASDPNDDNYRGQDCDAGGGKCVSGTCSCASSQIWCIPSGSTMPQCVSPREEETCGAHLIDGTNQCEFTACDPGQYCTSSQNDGLSCMQTECLDEDSQLCNIDDTNQCIPKLDPQNCGACKMNCSTRKNGNSHGSDCQKRDDNYECTYVCDDGYIDCDGTNPFQPVCVDLMTDLENCGECGKACPSGLECLAGRCTKQNCKPNQCDTQDANGKPICMNTDYLCGPSCTDCKLLGPEASCSQEAGICVFHTCEANQHPIYSGSSITNCEDNSLTACASPTLKPNQPIVNCNETKPDNASSIACSTKGECIVTECTGNNHLASDQKSCAPNTAQECGTGSSTVTKNCIISPIADATCSDGACTVTNCEAGNHINPDSNTCEKNSPTLCGPTNGAPKSCLTAHVLTAECAADGKSCTVTKCEAGYHINDQKTGCDQNSNTSCAPQNSNNAVNCQDIENSAVTVCSSDGKCQVTQCAAKFHINSSEKTACVPNSNSSCAAANSYSPIDCTQTFQTVCSDAGSCICADGKVANYDNNACVPKVCMGIPGVKTGVEKSKNWYSGKSDYLCNPTSCVSGYTLTKQNNEDAHSCRPKQSEFNCTGTMGYKYTDSNGYCIAKSGNANGHSHCKDGYRHYVLACIPQDVCCGTRNGSMSSVYDYHCTNCKAQGKTCSISSGKCQ